MAQSDAQRLINLGFPVEQAKLLAEMIAGGDPYTATQARAAIASKTEVAALEAATATAEDIVNALQA